MYSAPGTTRDFPLDFVKGMLVLVMVIYHVMNIFSTASAEAYGYIRFVSGSFIFISGYIIATFYEQKFQTDRIGTSKRLVVRGLKLLLVFTILNMLINVTGFGNPNKAALGMQQYLNNLSIIYIVGDTRYASFQILLPISYVLILSPALLLFTKFRKFLALVSFIGAFGFSFFNVKSFNIGFIIIGIIGISVGMITNRLEVSFSIKSRPILYSSLLVCMYLMGYMDRYILTYSIGVIIVIKLFYDIGMIADLGNSINRAIVLFGQYSLVCYIVQIIFLQALFRILSRQRGEIGYEMLSVFVIVNIFLVALCISLRYMRNQYKFMDISYRFVFS